MTEEQTALARRAVACRGWRWMAGMLCIWPNGNEWRVAQVSGIDGVNDCPNYPAGGWGDDYSDRTTGLPDLTDPATLGCLLALVREAWDDECLCILPVDYGPGGVRWACRLTATGTFCTGQFWPTEIGALVDALEKDCLDLEDLVDGE